MELHSILKLPDIENIVYELIISDSHYKIANKDLEYKDRLRNIPNYPENIVTLEYENRYGKF